VVTLSIRSEKNGSIRISQRIFRLFHKHLFRSGVGQGGTQALAPSSP
jgi:hypothetical protein